MESIGRSQDPGPTPTTFFYLMQHFTSCVLTDPEESIEADGHPVGQQLLHHGLCSTEQIKKKKRSCTTAKQCDKNNLSLKALAGILPPQHQFGVLGHVLLHQVVEESFEDVRKILQFAMQRDRQQGGNVGSVSGRESPLALQSVNELREEEHSGESSP